MRDMCIDNWASIIDPMLEGLSKCRGGVGRETYEAWVALSVSFLPERIYNTPDSYEMD